MPYLASQPESCAHHEFVISVSAVQNFAMLSVVFTAVGCQYFVYSRQTEGNQTAGVEAVGILLLLLNVVFVILVTVKIVRAGKAELQTLFKWLKGKWHMAGQKWRVFARSKARRWRGTRSFTSRDVAMTMSTQQSTGLAALVPERTQPDSSA